MNELFKPILRAGNLSQETVSKLGVEGYVVLKSPFRIDPSRLAEAYDAAVLAAHPNDVSVRSSTRITDFVNRGPDFDELYIYGPLLAACCLIIDQPFKLSTMHARTLEPGTLAEPLHVDFERDGDGWPMVGFIVMVDEFRPENGATRFVPRSHLLDVGDKKLKAHEEIMACGAAGSIIIYNGSIWHGYGANRSAKPRRSIQGAFIRRDARSGVDLPARMLPETLARISPLAKYLLNVCD